MIAISFIKNIICIGASKYGICFPSLTKSTGKSFTIYKYHIKHIHPLPKPTFAIFVFSNIPDHLDLKFSVVAVASQVPVFRLPFSSSSLFWIHHSIPLQIYLLEH